MKKTLLIAILMLLTGWLAGCDIDYHESYGVRRRPAPYLVAPRYHHRPVVCHPAPPVVNHRPYSHYRRH